VKAENSLEAAYVYLQAPLVDTPFEDVIDQLTEIALACATNQVIDGWLESLSNGQSVSK
jgi:hypothetical protein